MMKTQHFLFAFLLFSFLIAIPSSVAWWNPAYSYQYTINSNATVENLPIHINQTAINSWFQNSTETLYLYCDAADCSGQIAIANDTTEKCWENAATGAGNCPRNIWEPNTRRVYHLDNLNANDSSIYNTQLNSIGGSPILNTTDSIFGNSIQFNESNPDYLNLSAVDFSTGNFSISVWFNANVTTSERNIVSTNIPAEECVMYVGVTNKIYMTWWTGAAWPFVSYTGINSNQWYHAVATYDEDTDTLRLYVNGVLRSTLASASPPTYNEAGKYLMIGSNTIGTAKFNGLIDEVRIYNRTLGSQEILESYNNGINNLVALSSKKILVYVNITSPESRKYAKYLIDLNVSSFSAIDTWIYNLNGTGNVTFTPNITLNLTSMGDGVYSIIVYANTTEGEIGSASTNWTVHTTIPIVWIDCPLDGTYHNNVNFTIYGRAENILLDSVWTNNTGFGMNLGTPENWQFTYNNIPNGAYTVIVYANDTFSIEGNLTVSFVIDRNIPEYSNLITNIANGSAVNPINNYIFNSTWTDDNMAIVYLEFQGSNYTALNVGNEYYRNVGTLATGYYSYRWHGLDLAGNLNSTQIFTYHVYLPLTTIVTSPVNSTIYITNTVELNADANKPVDKWWYRINGSAPTYFTPNITLTLIDGSYLLQIYANDTDGAIASKDIHFSVLVPPPPIINTASLPLGAAMGLIVSAAVILNILSAFALVRDEGISAESARKFLVIMATSVVVVVFVASLL
jgi:hypothetical protein